MPPRTLMPILQDSANPLAQPGHFSGPGLEFGASRAAYGTSFVLSIVLLAAMVLFLPAAKAAGLGRLSVHSELGQALNAEVEVPAVGRDEGPSLQVRLASQAAFKQANLEFNPALTRLRFDLDTRPDGSFVVHISSAQTISEPYLDLLLELTWNGGRVLREYTVLLDPPGLHEGPQIVAPVVAPSAAVAAPSNPPEPAAAAPLAAAPAPERGPAAAPAPSTAPSAAPAAAAEVPAPAPVAAAPEAAPKPAPARAAAPVPEAAPAVLHVRPGDTLGKIALQNKPREVSLDQMLVALLQANPKAFINGNMNLLLAGKDVSVPVPSAALAIDQGEAHREVVAQSADFAAYRSRLSQIATAASTAPEQPAAAAGKGRVTAKVEDKSAAQKPGDQLKIAKADAAASAAAAAAARKDEEAARQRALKDEKARAAALSKANEEIRRANEVASKAAAVAQKQAEAARAAAAKAEAAKAETAKAEAAKAAAAKAAADRAAAVKAEAERVAAAKAEAARIEAAKLVAAKAEAAKAEAAKAEAAKAEAAKAEAAKAEAAKAEAAKAEAAKAEAAKVAAAKAPADAAPKAPVAKAAPAPAPAPAPATGSSDLMDTLTSPVVLASAGGGLLALLLGLNVLRRRRGGGADALKADGDSLTANSLFGQAGGQSVDTGATSTFNSSFIPAASQLDSNEVDPVAEADVYVAYGREEQAEDILKEALRLQPERHAVRVKLLEIYSRRADKASFNAVAQELHDRTGAIGDDWERAAKLGRTVDPQNPMYAGAAGASDADARGPTTNLRLDGGDVDFAGVDGPTVAAHKEGELEFDTLSHMVGDTSKLGAPTVVAAGPDSAMTPETAMPLDSRMASTIVIPPDSAPPRFEVKLPPEPASAAARAAPPTFPATIPAPRMPSPPPAPTPIDFGALDFDLGPSKLNLDAPTVLPPEKPDFAGTGPTTDANFEPPTIPSLDLMFPPPSPATRPAPPSTVSGSVPIPNIDLNLPAAKPPARPAAPAAGSLEEALSRPTLVGAVGAMGDGDMQRMSPNTDQATVPLIDFDLSGADAALTGRRTETQAGSPMASQMATKLDLARGYIDLGVKDGARELLEEVMKDGTREQRQQAVELIKLVEA